MRNERTHLAYRKATRRPALHFYHRATRAEIAAIVAVGVHHARPIGEAHCKLIAATTAAAAAACDGAA